MLTPTLFLLAALLPAPAACKAPASDATAWLFADLDGGLRQAAERNTLAMLYVWMDSSDHCQRLYAETLGHAGVQTELAQLVCVSVDALSTDGRPLLERFGVTTLPTLLFVNPAGAVEEAVLGFVPAPALIGEIQRIRSGVDTVSALRKALADDPEDLTRCHRLARKLAIVGAQAESDELLDSIRRSDPERRTLIGAQLGLWDLMRASAAESSAPSKDALRSVHRYLAKATHPEVLFEGWEWLAGAERAAGNGAQARRALANAWKHVPADRADEWGTEAVWQLWRTRGDLESADARWALGVAKQLAKRAEQRLEDLGKAPSDVRSEAERRLARQLDALAIAYHMQGQTQRGLSAIERAIELDPENAELQSRRALLLAKN